MNLLLKRGRRALLVSLIASLTILSPTADAEPGKPKNELQLRVPEVKDHKPPEPVEADFLPAIAEDDDCKKAKDPAKMKAREDGGEKLFACVESVSFKKEKVDKDNGPAGDVSTFAATPNPQSICTTTNTWWYSRKAFCVIVQDLLVNTNEVPSGKLVGQARWRIVHSSGLDARSPVWHNPSSWQVTYKWGQFPADVLTKAENFCSGCTGQRVGNPTAPGQKLALNQVISGTNNLSDNPGPEVVNPNIEVTWDDFVNCTGCATPVLLKWKFPLKVRCDFQTPVNNQAGCVVPAHIPEVPFTGFSSGNQSTALVAFIQHNNVDHWGSRAHNMPLTRMSDAVQAGHNRNVACAGFTPIGIFNEQCDEFPMARTHQSPAMIGLSGQDCSDLWPEWQGGSTWTWWDIGWEIGQPYSTSQRCGRGHVDGHWNGNTGQAYSNAIQNERILASDPFWIGIYN